MQSIANIMTYELPVSKRAERTLMIGAGVVLLTLGAYVRIPLPFTPVPVTLQTFFVLLIGAMMGRKYGVLTMLSYIGIGAVGMPVFQGYGYGFAHIAGPTGGYLAGFAFAAYVIGRLNGNGAGRTVLALLAGEIIIYSSGVLWLSYIFKLSIYQSFLMGVLPFLPGEILKLSAAAAIACKFGNKIRDYIV